MALLEKGRFLLEKQFGCHNMKNRSKAHLFGNYILKNQLFVFKDERFQLRGEQALMCMILHTSGDKSRQVS
ncbi:MAG: hypothetical protein KGY42_07270 [Desulfobacterales bacterium]|nr:hypothetical protein [Desulfobacterales bacterium]MBS3756201.1 hypothetical protein [Desulfobacterales bacterium]